MDYFKAFNDRYGYNRGDVAIRGVARILVEEAQRGGGDTFVGHIGGDDFVVLIEPDLAGDLGQRIIAAFDRLVPTLYDPEDAACGFVEVHNRLHVVERFPLMSLTLALVRTDHMQISHLAQLGDIAQELKSHGKGIPGSVMVGERRSSGGPGPAREDAA